MADATDLKVRFFCISKSIKSSPIYKGKSAKFANFLMHIEGREKRGSFLHTDAAVSRVRRSGVLDAERSFRRHHENAVPMCGGLTANSAQR